MDFHNNPYMRDCMKSLSLLMPTLALVVTLLSGCATPQSTPATEQTNTYDFKDVDIKPMPDHKRIVSEDKPAAPVSPSEPKSGEVIIQFTVDAQGVPQDLKIVSSTHKQFEEPALNAVKKWRFKPARKNGQAVACRMQVPIMFQMDE